MSSESLAPGAPGIPPRWTSSAKTGVGSSRSSTSRVWFTLSHGILDEIYYPRVDNACMRDMGLIITDGRDFFSEEKRHAASKLSPLAEGVPAFHLTNTCKQGRYWIEKQILADPRRHVVLQKIQFNARIGKIDDYHLYALLAPHLGNRGCGNTAWVDQYKGIPMLFAERNGVGLALACSVPWLNRSVGYVGFSDGWQDLVRHKQMTWNYRRAENGNVALTGEINLLACEGQFTLAIGLGRNAAEAAHRARASLLDGFASARSIYEREWLDWQRSLTPLDAISPAGQNPYRISIATIKSHESEDFPGGTIASLSIPWGFDRGDDDLGGYHLVWPRDMVEAAGAMLAAGATAQVHAALGYLQCTQESDGHWPQNMWMDGTPYWTGLQLDETAFPILLLNMALREGLVGSDELTRYWPMIRLAASYIVRNGPATEEDRWEEDAGLSPFTLAATIAGLLAAADFADRAGETMAAAYLRETADAWNASIERWTYVTDTDLSRQLNVEGYYVRISQPQTSDAASPAGGFIPIKNRTGSAAKVPATHLISPDALALVRFGLRSPTDVRILNTLKAIDALLKVETPVGPGWHRYNGDGYGEHEDGAPFDGTGIGRLWPLLTGERAHYELAAGQTDEAKRLLRTFESFANEGGLLPEQIWDSPSIPHRELYFGRPSGSAMPLVWAHAEHIKLLRSLRDGRIFDMPPQPVQRYLQDKVSSRNVPWRFNNRLRTLPPSHILRIETQAPATVHWSTDNWKTAHDSNSFDTTLGMHVTDLPTASLKPGDTIRFTFYWPQVKHWEGTDFEVTIS